MTNNGETSSEQPRVTTYEKGLVVEAYGSFYHVDIGGEVIPCVVRGKFRQEGGQWTSPVVVGDRVDIKLEEEDQGVIENIHPRENKLSRMAPGGRRREHILVANVSQALVIATLRRPAVSVGFIDRVLLACGFQHLDPLLCFNKTDLYESEKDQKKLEKRISIYRNVGLPVLSVSAKTGENLDELARHLEGEISVFVGQSGVGKSSLLNALDSDLELRVDEVSGSTNKGKHTTTYASLLKLQSGGYVVDTPGMREYGVEDRIEPEDLSYYFPDILEYLPQCKFSNCLHLNEPKCAVKKALQEGELSAERFKSYSNILETLIEKQKTQYQ